MYPANRKQTTSHGGSRSLANDAKSRVGVRGRGGDVMGNVMSPAEMSMVFMRATVDGGSREICT